MSASTDSAEFPAIALRPRRLTHVNLFVTEVEPSLQFYTDVCGMHQVFEEPEILAVFLGNGNSHHDLALMGATTRARIGRGGHVQVASDRGNDAALNHLGFEIEAEADLVAAIERARKAGFPLHRIVDHQISHSVYLFDPDGNYIEVYADVARDWRRIYDESNGQLITGSWEPDSAAESSAEPMYETNPKISVREESVFHPTRAARATFIVAELDRSRLFYERVVGLATIAEHPELGAVVMGGTLGQPDLSLIQRRHEEPLGLHHFGLELPSVEELQAGTERLRAAGIPIVLELEGPSKRSVVVGDPDDFLIEFFVVHEPASSRPPTHAYFLN